MFVPCVVCVTLVWPGIDRYEVRIEDATDPTLEAVLDWVSVGSATTFSSPALPLQHGHSYVTRVRALNGVGMFSEIESDSVTLDLTPPVAGVVRDGAVRAAGDQAIGGDLFRISAHWTAFTEPDSALDHYEWCVGTSPGTDNVVPCHSVGLQLKASAYPMDPSDGVDIGALLEGAYGVDVATVAASAGGLNNDGSLADAVLAMIPANTVSVPVYFSTVTAVSEVGLRASSYTDGVLLDLIPPSSGTAIDSSSPATADVDVVSSRSTMDVAWIGFAEFQTELDRIDVSVGTAPGLDDIQAPVSFAANASSCTLYNLPLVNGETYYATVAAVDGVGHHSSSTTNGVLVDWTAPQFDFVLAHDPALPEPPAIRAASDNNTITFVWSAGDAESGVQAYEVQLCKTQFSPGDPSPCAMDLITLHTTRIDLTAPDLASGVDYQLQVTAVSGSGLSSTAVSPTVVIDATPPTEGSISVVEVHEATEALTGHLETLWPITSQASWDAVAVQWDGFVDSESAVVGYNVCIGSAPFTEDLAPCRDVGLVQIAVIDTSSASAFEPASGDSAASIASHGNITKFYATVRATSGAGMVTSAVSQGVLVDTSSPVVGRVFDGTSVTDELYTTRADQLCVVAEEFYDLETGISEWEMCAGTTPGSCDIVPYAKVLPVQSDESPLDTACMTNIALQHASTVYATVRVTNGVGLTSEASSDGVLVVLEDPVAGNVLDAELNQNDTIVVGGADVDWYAQQRVVAASWSGFGAGAVVPIATYEVAVCLQLAGCSDDDMQLSFFADVGLRNNISFGAQVLEDGVEYQFHVRAIDVAGRSVAAVSDGFTIDTTLPTAGSVVVLSTGHMLSVLGAQGAVFGDNPLSDTDAARVANQVTSAEASLADDGDKLWHGGFSPMHIVWSGFSDHETGIDSYRVCASSSQLHADDLVPCVTLGADARYVVLTDSSFNSTAVAVAESQAAAAVAALKERLGLSGGHGAEMSATVNSTTSIAPSHPVSVFVRVDGCNVGGGCTPVVKGPVLLDLSPPVPLGIPRFLDSSGVAANATANVHMWQASWSMWRDQESGIAKFTVAVVDAVSDETVLDPVDVGLSTSFRTSQLSLSHGRSYVTEVTAYVAYGCPYRLCYSNAVVVSASAGTIVRGCPQRCALPLLLLT